VMLNRPESETEPEPYVYLKHVDGGVGPGHVLPLPANDDWSTLRYEPELAVIIRGPARNVPRDQWRTAVFGYTAFLEIVRPPSQFPPGESVDDWSKSWDTSWAIGPCIVPIDDVSDPGNGLVFRTGSGHDWRDVADPGHPRLPELIEFVSSVMTLKSGDVIACGAHDATVVPVQPGGSAEVEIPEIGLLQVEVGA
jgi:2-keto-4-pentenoate hydratase/2-oxohepta-3-ene-1,7-dioic acid hydratase in catechol pathway